MQTPNELLPDGLQMDLLWTNASPTSSFGQQTLNLDFTKYDFVLVQFKASATASGLFHAFIQKGTFIVNSSFDSLVYRYLTLSDTSIVFENAISQGTGTTNHLCIPYKVFGVK